MYCWDELFFYFNYLYFILVIDDYERYDIMKVLQGGKFLKGINDPKSETGEYPIEVTEVKPFYMDMFPVTNAQFW